MKRLCAWMMACLAVTLIFTGCKGKKKEAASELVQNDFLVGSSNDSAKAPAGNADAPKAPAGNADAAKALTGNADAAKLTAPSDNHAAAKADSEDDVDYDKVIAENLAILTDDEKRVYNLVLPDLLKAPIEGKYEGKHETIVDNCTRFPQKCDDILYGMYLQEVGDFTISNDIFALNLADDHVQEFAITLMAASFQGLDKLKAEFIADRTKMPWVQKTLDAIKGWVDINDPNVIEHVFCIYGLDAAGDDLYADFLVLAVDEEDPESEKKAREYWDEQFDKRMNEQYKDANEALASVGLKLKTYGGKVVALDE